MAELDLLRCHRREAEPSCELGLLVLSVLRNGQRLPCHLAGLSG